MKKKYIITFFVLLIFPLLVGAISASLSSKGMKNYAIMNKPPLSPPSWVFPVAWTILYILMGLASFIIYTKGSDKSLNVAALILYGLSLIMNFMWSIIFFRYNAYLIAFVWLIGLLAVVVVMDILYFKIDKIAGYVIMPYVFWLVFAAYLNFGSYLVNKV